MSNTVQTGGIGFTGALFLVFLVLRLTDQIDWAWYWIAAPLWIPFGLALAFFVTVVPFALWMDVRDGHRIRRKIAERKRERGLA